MSQKKKNRNPTLMHRCGIYKNDRDDLICKAEAETQMYRTNIRIPGGEGGMGRVGRLGLTHVHYWYHVKNTCN